MIYELEVEELFYADNLPARGPVRYVPVKIEKGDGAGKLMGRSCYFPLSTEVTQELLRGFLCGLQALTLFIHGSSEEDAIERLYKEWPACSIPGVERKRQAWHIDLQKRPIRVLPYCGRMLFNGNRPTKYAGSEEPVAYDFWCKQAESYCILDSDSDWTHMDFLPEDCPITLLRQGIIKTRG